METGFKTIEYGTEKINLAHALEIWNLKFCITYNLIICRSLVHGLNQWPELKLWSSINLLYQVYFQNMSRPIYFISHVLIIKLF